MGKGTAWPVVAVAVAVGVPAHAQVAPLPLPGTEAGIVRKFGDQIDPALSSPFGSFIAYTDKVRIHSEVWYCRLEGLTCPAFQVPPSAGNQFTPAVAGDVLVYVDEGQFGPRKGNVVLLSITHGFFGPVSEYDAQQRLPAVSDRLVAWEDDRDLATTGRDVWVHDFLAPCQPFPTCERKTGVGTQRSPRVSGTLVSYLDDEDGTVKVYDADDPMKIPTVAYSSPSSPAVFADVDGAAVVVETLAGDLEVRSIDGQLLAALALDGQQSNPHISGDWVAFEHVSTVARRVRVWNWRTGDLFAPPADTSSDTSAQTLNDISWPRVVYVDDRSQETGRDIYLYDTSADAGTDGGTDGGDGGADGGTDGGMDGGTDGGTDGGADGGGHGGRHGCKDGGEEDDHHGGGHGCKDGGADDGSPRGCRDTSAVALVELVVIRERKGPNERNVEFHAEAEIPVLVCIDAGDVSSAWVLLDDEAMARPNDFNRHVVHLERRRSVEAGPNRLGALVAGKPGAWLAVRVIPDPAGGPAPVAGAGLRTPSPGVASRQADPAPAQGCSGGAVGLAAALPLGAWLMRRRRPAR